VYKKYLGGKYPNQWYLVDKKGYRQGGHNGCDAGVYALALVENSVMNTCNLCRVVMCSRHAGQSHRHEDAVFCCSCLTEDEQFDDDGWCLSFIWSER
jgi:hypothetical protein